METSTMDKEKLQELANEFAKGLKTQHDLVEINMGKGQKPQNLVL